MWICIMGADGTGKGVIADILQKRNFKKIEQKLLPEEHGTLFQEFNYLTKRLSEQLSAQTVMHKQDVFTVRSIWDTYQVMMPANIDAHKIGQHEEIFMKMFNDSLGSSEQLEPPHCIIYTRMERRDIQDRMLLKGKQPNDEEIINQIRLYDELIPRIKVPVIELDMSQKPEVVRDELNFGIDSMKATTLQTQSIWKRTMFY